MIWFTSDTHFHHANIIRYCARPFASVDEMNGALIRNWNQRVSAGDTVYHLGDFAMGKKESLAPTRAKLNGRIVLVRGNHDRDAWTMACAGFDEVVDMAKLSIGGKAVHMAHHPPVPGENVHCDIRLCGHVHELWRRKGKVINVGVDVSGFRPLSLDELLARDAG